MKSRHLSEVLDLLNNDAELHDANIVRFSFDMSSIGDIKACLFFDQDDLKHLKFVEECGEIPRHLPPELNEVRSWVSSCERDKGHFAARKYDISLGNYDCHETRMWWTSRGGRPKAW